jgi:phosphoribosylformylglycinamidine (FGAM) synthase-like enzyme
MALNNLKQSSPAQPSKTGPDCTVCAALTELPKDKAALLLGALKNRQWRYSEIATEVAADKTVPEWVRNIAAATYAKHARGDCWEMRRRGEALR